MHKPPCNFCPQPGAFSPSQIKAFEFGCQRKWAFRHILNMPEPSFGFQELGKEVHKHLENYLRFGDMPPAETKAGQIALTGLDDLPKPSLKHIIEKHLYLERGGVSFHGFPDLMPYCEYAVDDHKTTADFKYALTEDELKCDPQALIYAMWLAEKQTQAYREKFEIALRWRYYRTRKPFKAMTVYATLSWAELQANFSRYVLEPALQMRHIRDSATDAFDANDLPGNTGSCEAYGGCPHKSRCSFHQTTGKVTMGSLFRDKLKAQDQAQTPAPAKSKSLFGKKSKASEPTICGDCNVAIDDAGKCGCNLLGTPDERAAREAENRARFTTQYGAEEPSAVLARGVVPPDAPKPVRELPEEQPVTKPAKGSKRGRPKGSKNKTPEPEASTEQWEITARPVADVEVIAPTDGKGNDVLVLCINAFPAKNRVTLLSEVLRPIVSDLSNDLGVSHYRLAKEAEYGRADALLLSAFLQSAPKLTGYVYVDKRDTDSAAVLGHLEAVATEIFRGAY